MAIKKYVAISYCFIFLAIYLSSISYALISTSINQHSNEYVLPQTISMNSTSIVLTSFVGLGNFLIVVIIVIVIITILFFILGARAMGAAI